MDNKFLAVRKDNLGLGFKSLELLIIAQIEEFQRTTGKCYVTNQQFSEMFGDSESSVKRALNELEQRKVISKKTETVGNRKNATKQRTLTLNPRLQWEPPKGGAKSLPSEVQNEPIEDNAKDNPISQERPVKKIRGRNSFKWEEASKIYDDYCDFIDEGTLAEKHHTTPEIIIEIVNDVYYDRL